MARGGINKALVKLAIDRLITKGEHPSIDAIRIELGNTGSKTTISRYLTELNEESAEHLGRKESLSDTISELVTSLAAQLHREADELVAQAKASHHEVLTGLQAKNTTNEKALEKANHHISLLQGQLAESEQLRSSSVGEVQQLLLRVERLTQELTDKDAQIAAKDHHIESLEDKHQHARQALEHYRESIKEQREQDQRRHETQVQQLQAETRQLTQTISIKQTDITQLNKDNSRLTAELGETRKQLRTTEINLQASMSGHKKAEDQVTSLNGKLVEFERVKVLDAEHLIEAQQQVKALEESIQTIQIELISTRTELTVKNQLFESLTLRVQ